MKQQQGMLTDKQKILTYSRNRFFREGFHKISMDEIARELGVSKSTIYKHFPNRDALVFESMNSRINEVTQTIKELIDTEQNAVLKFISLLNFLSKSIMQFSEKWMSDLRVHSPEVWIKLDEVRRKVMIQNLSRLIEQGKKEGLIQDHPTDVILAVFVGALRSVISPDFLLNSNLNIQEAIEQSFNILLNGVLTGKGKKVFKKLSREKAGTSNRT